MERASNTMADSKYLNKQACPIICLQNGLGEGGLFICETGTYVADSS
jgi:hypothetical protein